MEDGEAAIGIPDTRRDARSWCCALASVFWLDSIGGVLVEVVGVLHPSFSRKGHRAGHERGGRGWVGGTKGSRRCRERSPRCTFACCGLRCVLVVATCSCTIGMYMTRCSSVVPVRCCQVAVEMCFLSCYFICVSPIFSNAPGQFFMIQRGLGQRTASGACIQLQF